MGRVLVSVALCGCGAPATQTPRLAAPIGSHPSSASELAEVGNFADRGAPNGVVIWLRVPAPGRDIPLLGTLLGVGSIFDPNEMLNHKLGPSLSRTVDLSKPVDMTTSGLDDGVRIVLAAGIFDVSTFLSQVSHDFELVHKSQGRWQLLPKTKPTADRLECELWHAAPPVGARLICGTRAALIERQGEFLMAAARDSANRSNFHAEIPGKAAQDLLRKSAAQRDRKRTEGAHPEDAGERAGRAMGERWMSDWVLESSGFSWDLTLRRDSVDISQEMGFTHADSLFSTMLAGRTGVPKPVPDAFWQLPNDSDAALYWEGAEPELMRRQGVSLIHEMRAAMEADAELDSPPAKLDEMERTLGRLVLRGGAFEFAYGRDLNQAARALNEAAERASDRGPASGSADPALKKAQAQLGGWGLIGIEDESRGYLQALRDALRFATDKSKNPRKKGAKSSPPSPSNLEFVELPVPASAGLPSDTIHFAVRNEPNAKYVASKAKPPAPAPSAQHVIVVADAAQHLWLAIASDEALALARMRAVLRPEPATTLGASDDLRQLAKQPIAGLGFATLAGLNGLTLSADSKSEVLSSRNVLKQLWSLPKRGATRMPLWITRSQAGAGGQRSVVYNTRLTPDAIADLLATFMATSEPAMAEGEGE